MIRDGLGLDPGIGKKGVQISIFVEAIFHLDVHTSTLDSHFDEGFAVSLALF